MGILGILGNQVTDVIIIRVRKAKKIQTDNLQSVMISLNYIHKNISIGLFLVKLKINLNYFLFILLKKGKIN